MGGGLWEFLLTHYGILGTSMASLSLHGSQSPNWYWMTQSQKHIHTASAWHPISRMLLTNEILAFLESDSGTVVLWTSHTC